MHLPGTGIFFFCTTLRAAGEAAHPRGHPGARGHQGHLRGSHEGSSPGGGVEILQEAQAAGIGEIRGRANERRQDLLSLLLYLVHHTQPALDIALLGPPHTYVALIASIHGH